MYQGDLKNTPENALPPYIGLGYDLLVGNPGSMSSFDKGFRNPIFDLTYTKNQTTDDGLHLVPDNVEIRDTETCSYSSVTEKVTGTKAFTDRMKVEGEVSGGYKGLVFKGSFSLSADFEKMKSETENDENTVFMTSGRCENYRLFLPRYTHPQLKSDFIQAVN